MPTKKTLSDLKSAVVEKEAAAPAAPAAPAPGTGVNVIGRGQVFAPRSRVEGEGYEYELAVDVLGSWRPMAFANRGLAIVAPVTQ